MLIIITIIIINIGSAIEGSSRNLSFVGSFADNHNIAKVAQLVANKINGNYNYEDV